MAGGSGLCHGSCNGHEGVVPEKSRGFGGLGADHLRRNGEMNGGVSHGLEASGAEGRQSRREAGGRAQAFAEVAPVQTQDSEGAAEHLDVQAAVEAILRALGEDTSREGLIKTPLRVANAFKSAVRGLHSAKESPEAILRSALFSEEGSRGGSGQGGGTGGTVLIRDIECFSTCAECLLPLRLHCHVAYVPQQDCVVGISKLPRAALAVARRLQSPQGFVAQLCSAVDAAFTPAGVAVVAEAFHLVNLEHSVTATGVEPGLPCSAQGVRPSPAKENGLMNGHKGATEAGPGPAGLHRCPHVTISCGKSSGGGRGPRPGNDGSVGALGWAKAGMAGSQLLAAATGCLGAEESFEELLLLLGLARADVSLMLHRRGALWQLSEQAPEQGEGWGMDCGRDCAVEHAEVQPLPALFQGLLATEGAGARAQAGSYLAKAEGWPAGALGAAEVVASFCSNPLAGITKAPAASVEGPARRYLGYLMAATVGSGISQERLLGFLEEHQGSEGRRGDYGNGHADAPAEGNGGVLGTGGRGVYGLLYKEVQFGNRSICYHQVPISSLCEHHLLPFFGHLKVWYSSPSAGAQGRSHSAVVDPAVLECIALTFSRRLQVQERLTRQVAEAVDSLLGGCGAMAVIEASHLCMSVRGVERPGASTSSISTIGCFSAEPRLRAFCLGLR